MPHLGERGCAMYRSRDELRRASTSELVDFSESRIPTLRQMHAIEELAIRAIASPELVDLAVDRAVQHLEHAWRMGGLPVGYPGALELYRAGGVCKERLLVALAALPALVRDDLLRWVTDDRPEPAIGPRPPIERSILIDRHLSAALVSEAIGSLLDREVEAEVLNLPDEPGTEALVALTLSEWATLDQQAERLAARLQSTVYLWPPQEYYWIHPDLRLAVSEEGNRALVVATSAGLGYKVLSEIKDVESGDTVKLPSLDASR